jgi:hypothetical protein
MSWNAYIQIRISDIFLMTTHGWIDTEICCMGGMSGSMLAGKRYPTIPDAMHIKNGLVTGEGRVRDTGACGTRSAHGWLAGKMERWD